MRSLAFAFIILSFGSSCQKKTECHLKYTRLPAYLAFQGYSNAELDSINIKAYEGNGLFNILISDQWIVPTRLDQNDSALVVIDTICTCNQLVVGTDYEVTVNSNNKRYQISELVDYAKDYTFTVEERCPNGLNQHKSAPGSAKVNGDTVYTKPGKLYNLAKILPLQK